MAPSLSLPLYIYLYTYTCRPRLLISLKTGHLDLHDRDIHTDHCQHDGIRQRQGTNDDGTTLLRGICDGVCSGIHIRPAKIMLWVIGDQLDSCRSGTIDAGGCGH